MTHGIDDAQVGSLYAWRGVFLRAARVGASRWRGKREGEDREREKAGRRARGDAHVEGTIMAVDTIANSTYDAAGAGTPAARASRVDPQGVVSSSAHRLAPQLLPKSLPPPFAPCRRGLCHLRRSLARPSQGIPLLSATAPARSTSQQPATRDRRRCAMDGHIEWPASPPSAVPAA